MYIRTKSSPNSPRKTVQIVESIRHRKSVSQRIVQHVGVAQDEKEMEELKSLAAQIMEKLEAERLGAALQQKTLFEKSETKTVEIERVKVEAPVEDSLMLRASSLENQEDVVEGPFLAAEYLFEFFGLGKLFTRTPRDKSTKKLYRFPRKLSSHAKKLLKSLGIPYSTTPKEILSLSLYRRRFQEGMLRE